MAKVRIRKARIAFTQDLWEAHAFETGQDPTWGCTFLCEGKDDPKVEVQVPDGIKADGSPKFKWVGGKTFKQVMKEVAIAKWGAKGESYLAATEMNQKVCLRDGDGKPEFDGFPGNMFISGRNSKVAPLVCKDSSGALADEKSGIVYSGCYVHAVLDIYAQDNKWGRRINCGIQTVMFAADGEAFGGGARGTASDFDDLTAPEEDNFAGLAD